MFFALFSISGQAQLAQPEAPIVHKDVVFNEENGIVAVEAEHFYRQTSMRKKQWYRISKQEEDQVYSSALKKHCDKASNLSYIMALPDTRITHDDELIRGENFSDKPGVLAVLSYKVKINTPGRYFVWARALSSGSEDNGIHVGLNGNWPESGQRMQWCTGKNNWTWESKQRTKQVHCGVPYAIFLDIDSAGEHEIQFSMREDGFKFDKFMLSNNQNYVPVQQGKGSVLAQGTLPKPLSEIGTPDEKEISYFNRISKIDPSIKTLPAQAFPVSGKDYYKNGKNWLAINPEKHKTARTSTSFSFESGHYDIIFVGVGENDGRSTFRILLNGKELGVFQPPLTDGLWVEGAKFNGFWENVELNEGDKITVEAQVATDGNEWTRACWAGLVFAPVGQGKRIQDAPESTLFVK